MILLFLGSWRSTLIITVSIPLSILASIACLSALGETINIMTLGGLALAVGILVDDATVTIENINYQLEQGKDVEAAIVDGAKQIALPALVSTLSICIVFVPMFLLAGIARYPVRAARRGGGVRHAGLLPAVAHAHTHAGTLPAPEARPGRQALEEPLCAPAEEVPAGASSACSTCTGRCWNWPSRAASRSPWCSWRSWPPPPCWPFRSARSPAWARISFRASIPGSSSCITAPAAARASSRPPSTATGSSR